MKLRGLYAITPHSADGEALLRKVEQALEGGIAALQYRNKGRQNLHEARALAALTRRHGIPFIVNDDLDLALASGADGVHLGRDDGELAAARARLGSKIGRAHV